jgi:UDP-2,3-diacylglucosamine pyrophosphatase LpxH
MVRPPRNLKAYEKRIHDSLSRAWKQSPHRVKDVSELKLVIFSDHHRGNKDGADAFAPCKPAYHAALGYYLEAGFELYLLGDVEDLWQVVPEAVIQSYSDTLRLEGEFAKQNRYIRFWGNHDDLWQDPNAVQKYLHPWIDELKVLEGLRLSIKDKNVMLGELFFVHGHQGTSLSDRYAQISKPLVGYVLNPLRRLLRFSSTTPATNYDLRYQHERAMFEWARMHQGLVLFTGHTHRPVFTSETHGQFLREELELLKSKLNNQDSSEILANVQMLVYQKTAELHWVLAQTNGLDPELPMNELPCYFNPGCCSFSDGDITGIEIENTEIRLVRWPDAGNPWKRVLRRANLREVIASLKTRG